MKNIFFAIIFFTTMSVFAQQRFYPQAFIELYSSEGCENCPYADEFTKQIMSIADSAKQPVYVIDFHVDIWDRSGWKDPYSNSVFTTRQIKCAEKNNQPAIFTPMIFVNGEGAIPGGARKEIGNLINKALSIPRTHRLVTNANMVEGKTTLSVDYQIIGKIDSIDIHFALIKRLIKQNVTAGDNKGKILEHHNVVMVFESDELKSNNGHHDLNLPTSYIDLHEFALVTFLQKKGGGIVYSVDELLFK